MLSPRSCRSRASRYIGQTCSLFAVLSGILAGLGSCTTYGFAHGKGTPFEVVHPVRVDEAGQFVSHSVSRRVSRIHKRDLSSEDSSSAPVYYKLQHSGQDLLFNLSRNPHLLAPGFVSERRYGGLAGAKIRTHSHYSCQFIGEVQGQAATRGKAAISTCNGLMGVFQLSNEDFFIEPLGGEGQEDGAAQPHVIYKRHAAERGGERGSEPPHQSSVSEDPSVNGTCGVKESRRSRETTEKRRVKWEQKQRRHRRIRQRSISKEKWVETLVVADTKMVEYHGSEHVEDYVLAVMNMNVGCDYEINSNAVEDRCGVCHGNGSTCETVKKTFEESEGMGYVDIGLIPEGAREIRIEEVAEAGNFLALRSQDPERYFLNGGWTIQWNGDYKVAGTTFTYERSGNLENLTSPGPTREPVWIQLLFQETNPGVRYEYTIRRDLDNDNEIQPPEFFWLYGSWSACSASCGTGEGRTQ
ncbi:UNVERIFIED_CONTAM: hypothetical protein FKN15_005507 [Acipenser sinensis]